MEINLILRPKILELSLKPDSLFLQRTIRHRKLKLRIGNPLGPFHDTLFGEFEETDHDGLELLKIS